MIAAAAFVAFAAAGALGRAAIVERWNTTAFPTGTLVVNVSGAFLLGLLTNVAAPAITVVGVGGLGAFTTFSSFAGDSVALGFSRRVASYVAVTLVAGVAAAALGVALAG